MKQIIAKKGAITTTYRFEGKNIFIKAADVSHASQLIKQINEKGGKVELKGNWLLCDLIGDNDVIKLGKEEFEVKNKTEEELEAILAAFFETSLEVAGFKISSKII